SITEPDDFALRSHGFNREDVVRRHSILEAMRTAGIFGNVTADAARHLARWIRRVIQTVGRSGLRDMKIDNAGLYNGDSILHINRENPIHGLQLDDDAAFNRQRSPAQACACPARKK